MPPFFHSQACFFTQRKNNNSRKKLNKIKTKSNNNSIKNDIDKDLNNLSKLYFLTKSKHK